MIDLLHGEIDVDEHLRAIEVAECIADAGPDCVDPFQEWAAEVSRRICREHLSEQLTIVLVERPAVTRNDVADLHLVEEFAYLWIG